MPCFWFVTSQTVWNQVVNGSFVSAKIVPAVAEVSARQARQRNRPRRMRSGPPIVAQFGQTNPSGQRRRSRKARQPSSSENQEWNSEKVVG